MLCWRSATAPPLTSGRAVARGSVAAVLLAASRASNGRATTAPAEGPHRRSSGRWRATEWRGPAPRVQRLQRPLFYPATSARGRRTNVDFRQSYQSAGSPPIDYHTPLYNIDIYRRHAVTPSHGLQLRTGLSVVEGKKWREPELSRQPPYQPIEGISRLCHPMECPEIEKSRLRQA